MQAMFDRLASLVEVDDYAEAVKLCRSAWAAGQDPKFWETQLGYVFFLDFKSDEHWLYTLSIFEALVAKDPSDVNARFWLGYTYDILPPHNSERSKQELLQVLSLDPHHPYAHRLLASFADIDVSIRIEHLRQVLDQQRVNIRAYSSLIDLLLKTKQYAEAKRLYEEFHHIPLFIETEYGIMNEYMNDVFNGRYQEDELRLEIQQKLDTAVVHKKTQKRITLPGWIGKHHP
jgi:pentatricopeptide repeat protein